MRRCFSLFASTAALATPVTSNAMQNKPMHQLISGGYFSKDKQGPLQEAAQTRGYFSHTDSRHLLSSPKGPASAMTGKPFPKEQQRILAKAAKEKGLTSKYWVTRKQLGVFTPPLTLKEGAEPTELTSGYPGQHLQRRSSR